MHTSGGAEIEFREATVAYGTTPVVEDATLCIPGGAFVGIVGPSGAGKTSLLRAILGVAPVSSGSVIVAGQPVRAGRTPADVGYVPQVQSVDWHFPVTVREVVLLGRTMRSGPWPWPRPADRRAVTETLDRLGIGALAGRHIRELSGGQQQRVFLARALLAQPRVLLLDEPTSGVDPRTRDDVLRLLAEINATGVTIVLTTHELNAVAAQLPEVICINRRVLAQGAPEHVFTPEILERTYGAPMRVMHEHGQVVIADGAPGLRALLRDRHHRQPRATAEEEVAV